MTREEQMKAALNLLRPAPDKRGALEDDINDALNVMEVELATINSSKPLSKAERESIEAARSALKRAQIHIHGQPSEPVPRIRQYPIFLFTAEGFGKCAIQELIEKCQRLLDNRPHAKPHRDSILQQAAVKAAYELLNAHRIPCPMTRKGKWDMLARIFYGDKNLDMLNQLRRFKNGPKPGAK